VNPQILAERTVISYFIFMEKKTDIAKITSVKSWSRFYKGCLSAVYLRDIRHGDRPHKFLKVFMLEISLVNDVRSLGPSNTVSVYPIWFNLDRVDKIEIWRR